MQPERCFFVVVIFFALFRHVILTIYFWWCLAGVFEVFVVFDDVFHVFFINVSWECWVHFRTLSALINIHFTFLHCLSFKCFEHSHAAVCMRRRENILCIIYAMRPKCLANKKEERKNRTNKILLKIIWFLYLCYLYNCTWFNLNGATAYTEPTSIHLTAIACRLETFLFKEEKSYSIWVCWSVIMVQLAFEEKNIMNI